MEKIGEDGSLKLDETKELAQAYGGFTYFRNNDIIVAKITPCFENRKGAICQNLTNGIGFGTTELHVLRTNNGFNAKLIFYWTRSHPFIQMGVPNMHGTAGQKRVPADFIENFRITYPDSTNEQEDIERFLSSEIEKLNELIDNKQRLVELLHEHAQATINNGVMRGFDASVPMKHSGIEWIEDIPTHWNIIKINNVCNLLGRIGWRGLTTSDYREDGPILLGVTNISRDFTLDLSNLTRISQERYDESPEIKVQQNDILLAKSGATTGKVCLVENIEEPTTVNAAVNIIRPNTNIVHPKFVYYFLASDIMQKKLFSFSSISAQPNLFQRDIRKLSVVIPPVEEQESISVILDKKVHKTNSLIRAIKKQIEKLLEYRESLILSALTGQIDVRRGVNS